MENIMNYIRQNPVIAVVIAALLMFLAGLAVRRLKFIAIIFIIIAAFAFYVLIKDDKVGKIKINEIKQNTKNKVLENIKNIK
jgi:hypothetical protein